MLRYLAAHQAHHALTKKHRLVIALSWAYRVRVYRLEWYISYNLRQKSCFSLLHLLWNCITFCLRVLFGAAIDVNWIERLNLFNWCFIGETDRWGVCAIEGLLQHPHRRRRWSRPLVAESKSPSISFPLSLLSICLWLRPLRKHNRRGGASLG